MKEKALLPAHKIVFGMNRETDERAITSFIKRFADDALLAALVPRLEDQEIEKILDLLSSLMGKHFSDKEYHNLFLPDK
jgi:hypothetical protein